MKGVPSDDRLARAVAAALVLGDTQAVMLRRLMDNLLDMDAPVTALRDVQIALESLTTSLTRLQTDLRSGQLPGG
jgi:hypothetical protein